MFKKLLAALFGRKEKPAAKAPTDPFLSGGDMDGIRAARTVRDSNYVVHPSYSEMKVAHRAVQAREAEVRAARPQVTSASPAPGTTGDPTTAMLLAVLMSDSEPSRADCQVSSSQHTSSYDSGSSSSYDSGSSSSYDSGSSSSCDSGSSW